MEFHELDPTVKFFEQMREDAGPVILINTFTVAAEDAEALLQAWTEDAAFMKRQPGFISTQLHRGIAGSSALVNYAVWESTDAFRRAFAQPEFQGHLSRYPQSAATQAHLFARMAVPGICVD